MSKSDPLTNKEIVFVVVTLVAASIGAVVAYDWGDGAETDELLRAALALVVGLAFLVAGLFAAAVLESKREVRKHVRRHHSQDESSHREGATPSP
jgi:hypothetical protein